MAVLLPGDQLGDIYVGEVMLSSCYLDGKLKARTHLADLLSTDGNSQPITVNVLDCPIHIEHV